MQPSRLDPEFLNLPVLKGLDLSDAKPGSRLYNDRLDYALALQDALSGIAEVNFKVRSIDVTKEYAAVVTDASNARYTFGNKDLAGQMERLKKLLVNSQEVGRQIDTANLMLVRNTPVTFVLTPETPAARIIPVSNIKKDTHH
jgi:hypothetical protein